MMSDFGKFISVVLVLLASSAVVAETKRDPWDAFEPPPDDKFDWIQMSSGEWFKGELKVMYNFSLEFDSDELDLLELDFDDVERVRTAGEQRVLVETGCRDTKVLAGKLRMNGERVQLVQGGVTNDIERYQVISIAGGSKRERDNWSGDASLGATVRGGNTETADLTAMFNVRRRTAMSRLSMDYFGNYSAARKVDTANNHRVNGYFDWFLTGRFYWQVLAAEYYRDPFVNIKDQYSVSSGVGYDIVRNSKTEWTLNTGLGYQETKFDSVVPPDDESSSSPFGTIGTRLDHEVNGNIDFLFDYGARFLNETSGSYTHHMVTTLSVELVADLDIDLSLIWDRIDNPQPTDDGAGGTTYPEQDDYQLVVGIGYDF